MISVESQMIIDTNVKITDDVLKQMRLFTVEDNGFRKYHFDEKVDVAKDFLNVLNAKDLVSDVLNTGVAEDIKIYIGEETAKDELKNFSIVTFNHLLEDRDIGTIGIIGPTRMDYSKVISVMKYISKKLNEKFDDEDKEGG